MESNEENINDLILIYQEIEDTIIFLEKEKNLKNEKDSKS